MIADGSNICFGGDISDSLTYVSFSGKHDVNVRSFGRYKSRFQFLVGAINDQIRGISGA
jgi:hypothetical protein